MIEKQTVYRVKFPTSPERYRPSNIVKYLDQYVIGQEEAKKTLAYCVSNYISTFDYNSKARSQEDYIERSNLLLTGHSGSGKTLLLTTLKDIFPNLVVVSFDCSSFSQSGYVGSDVSTILNSALTVKYNITGTLNSTPLIIHLDEFDKLATGFTSGDVSTVGVQRELLKLVEGTEDYIMDTKENSNRRSITDSYDTRSILWVFTGAFSDLVKQKKLDTKGKKIGFNNIKSKDDQSKMTLNDIMEYGIIRELAGRIGLISTLEEPSREDMINILKNSKVSPINKYKKLAAIKNIPLQVDNKVLEYIVDEAIKLELGARGLKSIADQYFMEQLFN